MPSYALIVSLTDFISRKALPSVALSDLTAQSLPRIDNNGKKCAVVKVLFVGDVVSVEGGAVGDLVRHTNEVWVYMPQNTPQMRVITKEFLPITMTFANYGVERLGSGMTYELTLVKPVATTAMPTTFFVSSISEKPTSVSPPSSNSFLSGSTITIPISKGVNIEMVRVEAGSFIMGAMPEMQDSYDYEKATYCVTYQYSGSNS